LAGACEQTLLWVQRQFKDGAKLPMTKLDAEFLNRLMSHIQFEGKAKSSLIWLYDSLRLFRASQILYQTAKNAQYRKIQILIQEHNQRDRTETSTSRPETLEEYTLGIDSSLVSFAYFYLSRSIELLCKAILIERQEDYFLKTGKDGKLVFDVQKLGHKLTEYVQECSIVITEKEEQQVLLLQDLLYWGTFPIPLSEEDLYKALDQQSNIDFRLNIKHYDDISLLFDKILDILNEERLKNGISIFNNVFR